MMLSPGCGFAEAQLLAHPVIPGACSHGVVLDVPLGESEPFAAM